MNVLSRLTEEMPIRAVASFTLSTPHSQAEDDDDGEEGHGGRPANRIDRSGYSAQEGGLAMDRPVIRRDRLEAYPTLPNMPSRWGRGFAGHGEVSSLSSCLS